MFMDCIRNQTHQCAQYKLKVFTKHDSRNTQVSILKNQLLGFPCCSTGANLSIYASITTVGLILTKPGRFLFSGYGNSGYGQNSISFLKKNSNFWVSML